jgi:hypothetical protein
MTAEEALKLGLVNRLVARDNRSTSTNYWNGSARSFTELLRRNPLFR